MRSLPYLIPSLVLACNSGDWAIEANTTDLGVPVECGIDEIPDAQATTIETCVVEPGFDPVVEWTAGDGKASDALPAVADLWQDGHPEIIAVFAPSLPMGKGTLKVLHGDGSGEIWSREASLGFGSGPSIGDVTGDGVAEILVVRSLGSDLLIQPGVFTVMAYSRDGTPIWESAQFSNMDFDYATGINLADMDHDGNVEVVAGRVILNGADGSTRGVGEHSKG